jgi:hypothetical protein
MGEETGIQGGWGAYFRSWDEFEPLADEAAGILLHEFAKECVRPEFEAKFLREFGKYLPIGERYFVRFAGASAKSSVATVFETPAGTEIIVEAVYVLKRRPSIFRLRGSSALLSDICVEECDTVARARLLGNRLVYLFMSGVAGNPKVFLRGEIAARSED